jgi:hypothetical protein
MIFHHNFDSINNFIIICDRIKINCQNMFIRIPMMCVQYNKYMFNFIDINSFISVSGYIDLNFSAWLFPGAYCAVKTALLRPPSPTLRLNARSNKSLIYFTTTYQQITVTWNHNNKMKMSVYKNNPDRLCSCVKNKLQKNLQWLSIFKQIF